MDEGATARYYGRILGMLSGLFAVLQVLVSVAAARANMTTIQGVQIAFDNLSKGILTTPLNLLSDLIPVLVTTYAALIVGGCVMLWFAWYAGRLTAQTIQRQARGASAGLLVALYSGLIWIVASILSVLAYHVDGTISGIFTSSTGTGQLGGQIAWLLAQELIAVSLSIGFGALAGHIGARSARVAPRSVAYATPFASPFVSGAPLPYPAPYQPYPTSGPVASAPVYPPPPDYYQRPGDWPPTTS